MSQIIDLVGKRFGRLVVLAMSNIRKGRDITWECSCDCGKRAVVRGCSLRHGITTSCGCYHRERLQAVVTKHGECWSPEYVSWESLKGRCLNPKNKSYARYGGRGITVYEPWVNDFPAFLAHVGKRPTLRHQLDRIDNARGYEPGNVRWATVKEQARNRRSNVMLTLNGQSLCATDWAPIVGLSAGTIVKRVRRGWSDEAALTTPWKGTHGLPRKVAA